LESREVKLGPKAEGFYEVIEGLSEGDIVVTSGNFLIDSESRLKSVIPGSGSDGEGHKHGQ
ncbi:MAG: efflux transporter periplasmic adaptor subunit, partial [Candidatus Omnitrophota bacterium]|nr:efflux transporter periplasmic adaptor subunit [Candidatus Omnitrophota bacterium]